MHRCDHKFILMGLFFLASSSSWLGAQSERKVTNPSLPGYSGFHSNLGIQEIVEVGVPLSRNKVSSSITEQKKPSVPPAQPVNDAAPSEKESTIVEAIKDNTPAKQPIEEIAEDDEPQISKPAIVEETKARQEMADFDSFDNDLAAEPSATEVEGEDEKPFSITPQMGFRAYRTSNVLRERKGMEKDSGVFETNIGVGVAGNAKQVGNYISMIPRLDLMMQWAGYGTQSRLLNYRFGLVKGGVAIGLPNDWSAGVTLDYNILHNRSSGDRTFDAWSPAISLQRIYPIAENSFLMGDIMMRQSYTNQAMTFPAAGVFADSGDNRQYTASLTYVHVWGEEGQFTFMPRLAYTHTQYLKSPSQGRDDRLLSIGASLMYQWTDWLSVQTFLTNTSMSSDVLPSFNATDYGVSLSASHRF